MEGGWKGVDGGGRGFEERGLEAGLEGGWKGDGCVYGFPHAGVFRRFQLQGTTLACGHFKGG